MEENTKKITLWKIIKWTMISISILVYLLIFARIFVSCDAKVSNEIILTREEKAAFDDLNLDYKVFNYQPSSWTNDDGTIQIKNVYYLEPIHELQLTVRYRISSYDTEENNAPFTFELRVVEGEEEKVFSDLEYYIESRYDYKYIRLCENEIEVSDGETHTYPAQRVDENGKVTYETVTETTGGNEVFLDIYDSETHELLYTFRIAGRTVGGARVRRNKCEVRIID